MKNHNPDEGEKKNGGSEPTPPALQAAPEAVKHSMPMALSIMLGLLGAVAVGWLIYHIGWLILLIYFSIVLATILDAPISYVQSKGLSRTWATVLMMGAIVLVLGVGIFLLINWLASQTQALIDNIQQARGQLGQTMQALGERYPALLKWLENLEANQQWSALLPDPGTLWRNAVTGVSTITYIVVIFFLVMYLSIEGRDQVRSIFSILPKPRRRELADVWREMATTHRRWFLANMANVGSASTLTTLGLWLLGIPGAPILGVVAGLGELVPNVGPFFGALPTLGLVILTQPSMLLWVIIMFLIVQTIQGYTISPLVMKFGVRLPVLIIIVAALAMGSLLGILGILLAIPLTSDLLVLWNYLNRYMARKGHFARSFEGVKSHITPPLVHVHPPFAPSHGHDFAQDSPPFSPPSPPSSPSSPPPSPPSPPGDGV